MRIGPFATRSITRIRHIQKCPVRQPIRNITTGLPIHSDNHQIINDGIKEVSPLSVAPKRILSSTSWSNRTMTKNLLHYPYASPLASTRNQVVKNASVKVPVRHIESQVPEEEALHLNSASDVQLRTEDDKIIQGLFRARAKESRSCRSFLAQADCVGCRIDLGIVKAANRSVKHDRPPQARTCHVDNQFRDESIMGKSRFSRDIRW